MKAKHISKIRLRAKYFMVLETDGMFGDFKGFRGSFPKPLDSGIKVFAYNHLDAVQRAQKRKGYGCSRHYLRTNETTENFGHFRCYEIGKPHDGRFVKYF